jgi:hypothetical protein
MICGSFGEFGDFSLAFMDDFFKKKVFFYKKAIKAILF